MNLLRQLSTLFAIHPPEIEHFSKIKSNTGMSDKEYLLWSEQQVLKALREDWNNICDDFNKII